MNTTLTRRALLRLGVAGLAMGVAPVFATARQPMTGRILGVSTISDANTPTHLSRIVALDLVSGNVTYHELGEHRAGHSLLPLPGGGYYATPYGDDETGVIFLDAEFRRKGEIKAPAGHGYGGHSLLLADNRRIVGHFNRTMYGNEQDPKDFGQLYVVDIETQSVISAENSQILHGHDMLVTNDGRHIVIGDDGTIATRFGDALAESDNPFALIPGEPQFVVYDAKTLKQVRRFPLDINGAVVHIAQDADGFIYGGTDQFVANNPAGKKELGKLLGQDAETYVNLLDDSLVEEGWELPYPGPLIRADLETGAVEKHTGPENQMPFDVNVNAMSGQVFHVFTQSNVLARFDPLRKRWGYFSTEPYSIEMPYGVSDIPGTTLMAVNGFEKGISVFDTTNMALVQNFETTNFGIKHLLYEAV